MTDGMNWLRDRREDLRMSQGDLMAKLQLEGFEVSQSTISNWENGRYNMPLDQPHFRSVLAKTLKLSEKQILKLSGYKVETEHSEAAERAADIIEMLPADKQAMALRMLESMIG